MSTELPLVTVVVPLYNEAPNIDWFYKELSAELSSIAEIRHEILYINDGSRDETDQLVSALAKQHDEVRYVCLARNFGKEAATSAGLHYAHGDAVVVLDGDGQHPPQLIKEMVNLWIKGAQQVVGIRTSNLKAGYVKRIGSRLFYTLSRSFGASNIMPNTTDFRLIDRELVDVFQTYKEKKRMTRALLDWSGFNTEYIKFDARDREHGVAAYNFRSLLRLAVNGYISATLKPLYMIGALGLFITFLTTLALFILIVDMYVLNDPFSLGVSGSAIITLFVTLLVGMLMISQGIVALYVANIHLEAQSRPLYIVNKARSKLNHN